MDDEFSQQTYFLEMKSKTDIAIVGTVFGGSSEHVVLWDDPDDPGFRVRIEIRRDNLRLETMFLDLLRGNV